MTGWPKTARWPCAMSWWGKALLRTMYRWINPWPVVTPGSGNPALK